MFSVKKRSLHAHQCACPSVVSSNCALVNFPLHMFQPSMEDHQTSSSGDADMRICPQVYLTDIDSKRAPKNLSLRQIDWDSFCCSEFFNYIKLGSSSATLPSTWCGSTIISPMFHLLCQVLLLIMTRILRILTIKYYHPSLGYSRKRLLILLH